jgi:hypothetical protein
MPSKICTCTVADVGGGDNVAAPAAAGAAGGNSIRIRLLQQLLSCCRPYVTGYAIYWNIMHGQLRTTTQSTVRVVEAAMYERNCMLHNCFRCMQNAPAYCCCCCDDINCSLSTDASA